MSRTQRPADVLAPLLTLSEATPRPACATGVAPRGGGGVDFFPTPAAPVRALLAALSLPGGIWLEPSVGSAAIPRAVATVRRDVRWIACELRDVRPLPPIAAEDLRIGDFLDPATIAGLPRPDVIMGNVPYGDGLLHSARCVEVADGRAWVALLHKLNFLATEERATFLRAHPPDVYPLSRRPSFTGGGTDGTEYAWIVWPPFYAPRRVGCAPIDVPSGQLSLADAARAS